MKAQYFSVRGKSFFVCDYTGAPIEKRFFIPVGKYLKGKEGCYATLPILLRAVFEKQGNQRNHLFEKIKSDCESFYNQPNIPMAPALEPERLPLSIDQLSDYLLEIDMGAGWMLVPNCQMISDKVQPIKRRKVEAEVAPTQKIESSE